MGNYTSSVADDRPTEGFRVLNVQPNSPAADVVVFPDAHAARDGLRAPVNAALVSFLDFIVSVNGEPLSAEDSEFFAEEVRENAGQPVILEVWNTKSGKMRTCQIVPRRDWGGEGLLGLHVKWDAISDAAEGMLHVVEVEVGSPADECGLIGGDDFVLGSPEGGFGSVDAFADAVAYAAADLAQAREEEAELARGPGDHSPGSDGGGGGGRGSRSGSDNSSGGGGAGGSGVREPPSPPGPPTALLVYVLRASTDTVRQVRLCVERSQRQWGPSADHTGVGLTLASGHMHQLPNCYSPGRNEFELDTRLSARSAGTSVTAPGGQLQGGGGGFGAHPQSGSASVTGGSGSGQRSEGGSPRLDVSGPPLPLQPPPPSPSLAFFGTLGSTDERGGGGGGGVTAMPLGAFVGQHQQQQQQQQQHYSQQHTSGGGAAPPGLPTGALSRGYGSAASLMSAGEMLPSPVATGRSGASTHAPATRLHLARVASFGEHHLQQQQQQQQPPQPGPYPYQQQPSLGPGYGPELSGAAPPLAYPPPQHCQHQQGRGTEVGATDWAGQESAGGEGGYLSGASSSVGYAETSAGAAPAAHEHPSAPSVAWSDAAQAQPGSSSSSSGVAAEHATAGSAGLASMPLPRRPQALPIAPLGVSGADSSSYAGAAGAALESTLSPSLPVGTYGAASGPTDVSGSGGAPAANPALASFNAAYRLYQQSTIGPEVDAAASAAGWGAGPGSGAAGVVTTPRQAGPPQLPTPKHTPSSSRSAASSASSASAAAPRSAAAVPPAHPPGAAPAGLAPPPTAPFSRPPSAQPPPLGPFGPGQLIHGGGSLGSGRTRQIYPAYAVVQPAAFTSAPAATATAGPPALPGSSGGAGAVPGELQSAPVSARAEAGSGSGAHM